MATSTHALGMATASFTPGTSCGSANSFSPKSVPAANVAGPRRSRVLQIVCKESRIGKRPIEVPKGVNVTLEGQELAVNGPLGQLSISYPREIAVRRDESGVLHVARALETRRARQMHGLFRCYSDPEPGVSPAQLSVCCLPPFLIRLLNACLLGHESSVFFLQDPHR